MGMSVQTCRRIFPFFSVFFLSSSLCFTCKRFICFYSAHVRRQSLPVWPPTLNKIPLPFLPLLNNPYPFPSEFHENELGTTSFSKVLFFVCFPSILIAKKRNLLSLNDSKFHWWCSFSVCVQKLASKIASLSLAHDCDQVERKCDQKNGARARSEKFCDWHRKDFSSPEQS